MSEPKHTYIPPQIPGIPKKPLLKVCGMRDPENIASVASLQPEFMGFIFWEKSKRFVRDVPPELPKTIKKIGVVVGASEEEVLHLIEKQGLDGIQLHGKESPAFCEALKNSFKKAFFAKEGDYSSRPQTSPILIKAFSVGSHFDFKQLKAYEPYCDYFLFDTKGKLPGGNGHSFSWSLLKDYPSKIPYFLSGGIGLDSLDKLSDFLNDPAAKQCAVIDVNSTFELSDYTKDVKALAQFKNKLENLTSP
ncbi:MAG: phosphoribosylanthranilate isomerase [Flavobacteriaceae bacterium]|nr:phosphoribosylanthranilate isomerase [Flavobacteriaceae bacterium]MCI5089052.1 phosphoribosylanthranilate isomerase [Flavobacteriaceae bacterium]